MRQNVVRKTYAFEEFPLIDLLLKDKSYVEKRSESAITEQLLLDNLLPRHRLAASIVRLHYSEPDAVFNMLYDIASYCETYPEIYASSEALPLVLFVSNEVIKHRISVMPDNNRTKADVCDLLSSFKIIVSLFEQKGETFEHDSFKRQFVKQELIPINEAIDRIQNELLPHTLSSFTAFLVHIWGFVCDSPHTYRALKSIIKLCEFEDTPERRQKVLRMISTLSENWDDSVFDD